MVIVKTPYNFVMIKRLEFSSGLILNRSNIIQFVSLIALCQILLVTGLSIASHNDTIAIAGDDSNLLSQLTWKFQFGDDLDWADPVYDDSTWAYIDAKYGFAGFPLDNWQGNCWYRLEIDTESKYKTIKYLGLAIRQIGACEIFFDGVIIQKYGIVGKDANSEEIAEILQYKLIPIYFDSESDHVIAIRYSNHQDELVAKLSLSIGIDGFVSEHSKAFLNTSGMVRTNTTYQMFFTGLLLAFGLIHLILFLFYPKWKPNLHFAATAIFMATLNYFALGANFATDIQTQFIYNLLFKISVIGLSLAGMRLVYSLIDPKPPRQFWYFFGGGALLALSAKVLSVNYIYIWLACSLVIYPEDNDSNAENI